MWRFANPVTIHWGDEWTPLLRSLLPSGPGLLIAHPQFQGSAAAGLLEGIPTFSGVDSYPNPVQVQQALDMARPLNPKWILAVGGGSVLDTAKLVRLALACNCPSISGLLQAVPEEAGAERPRLIAAPSTHGTGAELTMWATVWDKENSRKLSISHPINFPDSAVYCPSLTFGLPQAVSIATTLDALAHALESLWNRNDNPISDELAASALGIIAANLELLADPVPAAVRASLLRASLFAGLAFANTRTAAAHSISYPLTLRLGIPHGIACAMTLPALWRINAPHMRVKAERLRLLLGGEDMSTALGRMLRFAASRVPFTLSAYGAGATDLDSLMGESFTKGRMDNNLVGLDQADVRAMLEAIF